QTLTLNESAALWPKGVWERPLTLRSGDLQVMSLTVIITDSAQSFWSVATTSRTASERPGMKSTCRSLAQDVCENAVKLLSARKKMNHLRRWRARRDSNSRAPDSWSASLRWKEFNDRPCSKGVWREPVRSNVMITNKHDLPPPTHVPCHPE